MSHCARLWWQRGIIKCCHPACLWPAVFKLPLLECCFKLGQGAGELTLENHIGSLSWPFPVPLTLVHASLQLQAQSLLNSYSSTSFHRCPQHCHAARFWQISSMFRLYFHQFTEIHLSPTNSQLFTTLWPTHCHFNQVYTSFFSIRSPISLKSWNNNDFSLTLGISLFTFQHIYMFSVLHV